MPPDPGRTWPAARATRSQALASYSARFEAPRRAVDRRVHDRRPCRAATRRDRHHAPRDVRAAARHVPRGGRRRRPPPRALLRRPAGRHHVDRNVQRENIAGTGGRGSDNPVEGIEQLIGVTGGKLLNLGAATSRVRSHHGARTRRITSRRSIRSDPTAGDRMRWKCASRAPGVDVRGSRAITFVEPDARARPPSPSPRDMLVTTAEFRDLPLRAAGYSSFEETGGQIRVLTLAEAVEPTSNSPRSWRRCSIATARASAAGWRSRRTSSGRR